MKDAGLVEVGARIHDMTFSGASVIPVPADPYDPQYATTPPHWLDDNLNGDTHEEPDQVVPIAAVRGSQVYISANFQNTYHPASSPQASILIQAIGPGGLSVPVTTASPTATGWSISEVALTGTLPDYVHFYSDFDFSWLVSIDGGLTWEGAGTTHDIMFVTLEESMTDAVFMSPIFVSTTAAEGTQTREAAISKAWDAFASLSVGARVWDGKGDWVRDPQNPSNYLIKNPFYYKNWMTTNSTWKTLLRDQDGGCNAWSDFFLTSLAGQFKSVDGMKRVYVALLNPFGGS